jgi:hypothetical protein
MCYERYLRRREREAEESREMWRDFERTTPLAGDEPPAEETEIRADSDRETTPAGDR